METTPCGLLKFNELDTYNYSDAKTNFDRPDELLARLGAHSSRVFHYNGIAEAATLGVEMDSAWELKGFSLRGMGEWFSISVTCEAKVAISRSNSRRMLSLPELYSAMHTQKLSSGNNGRGARGWISSAGVVNLGTTSGSDSSIPAGSWIQLSGWYLPQNKLTTIGVPTTGEKSPFFSSYINTLNIIDTACKTVNTQRERNNGAVTLTISGNTAKKGTETIFTVNSTDFSLTQAALGLYNDFAFFRVTVKSKKSFNILPSGIINHKTFGVITSENYMPYASQPLEPDNTGRVTYSYMNESGEIILTALGRMSPSGSQTAAVGEEFSVTGFYRLKGTE